MDAWVARWSGGEQMLAAARRAGKSGTAITFVSPAEYRRLSFIKRAAQAAIQDDPKNNALASIPSTR